MKIPFEKTFVYEDYSLDELDLDLDGKMTARLQEAIDAEFRRKAKGEIIPFPYLDSRYRLIAASKITGIPKEVLTEIPYQQYNVMHNAILLFFMNSQEPSTDTPESD